MKHQKTLGKQKKTSITKTLEKSKNQQKPWTNSKKMGDSWVDPLYPKTFKVYSPSSVATHGRGSCGNS